MERSMSGAPANPAPGARSLIGDHRSLMANDPSLKRRTVSRAQVLASVPLEEADFQLRCKEAPSKHAE